MVDAEASSGSVTAELSLVSLNLFFINPDNSYCSNVYMTYSNPSGDEIQYYAEIDILQFK